MYVRRKTKKSKKRKKKKKSAPPKTHQEIHSSPATATTSRRRATINVPRVSPYSPASRDPGFVENDLVQLSQSVKTTNVTHTLTDIQTDRQTNQIMAPCAHPGMKTYRQETASVASLPRPCIILTICGHGLFPISVGVRRVSPLSPVWGRAWARTRIVLFFGGVSWQ